MYFEFEFIDGRIRDIALMQFYFLPGGRHGTQ